MERDFTAMNNLEKSAVVITKILARLAETGLQGSTLQQTSLDLDDELRVFFPVCFKWLQSEGLVRAANVKEFFNNDLAAVNPVLTARGFQMLGQELEFRGKTTNLEMALKDAARDSISVSSVGDFLGGLLGGFTKSLGSG